MDAKPVLYLDWNILNKLWSPSSQSEKDRVFFLKLEEAIEINAILVPYSNAHIRDLSRGVTKRPEFAKPHVETIRRATSSLCITQYWSEQEVRWHYRDPSEFLDTTLNDKDFAAGSFSELFDNPEWDDMGALAGLHKVTMNILGLQQLPPSFKKCFQADPIFLIMFPKARVENTMKALCEDIYVFSRTIMSDHALYKHFRKFLNSAKAKSMEVRKMETQISGTFESKPSRLTWDEMWEQAGAKSAMSKNKDYDRIIDLYTRTDLKGYSPDERFSNLIDDALHTFYGAQCDYFLTLDNRCLAKAKKVYAELNIQSKALSLTEFYDDFGQ